MNSAQLIYRGKLRLRFTHSLSRHPFLPLRLAPLYRLLATQSIEARAQQEGCRQACTIGLSINEDTKLEKGKEKKGSTTRSFMRSLSHMSSRDCVYHNIYHNPLFSTSAVTLPPPSVKPALRLYGCIIPIGRSYPYALPVAYCLYYASIPSIY